MQVHPVVSGSGFSRCCVCFHSQTEQVAGGEFWVTLRAKSWWSFSCRRWPRAGVVRIDIFISPMMRFIKRLQIIGSIMRRSGLTVPTGRGWWVPAVGDAQGTVIHFHGKGRNMTAHIGFVHWLAKEGFNLFVFDYRGYGQSAGRPQHRGVYQDGVAAIRYVQSRTDVDPDRIVILGQSLGGGGAIAVMGHEDFPGVRGGRRIDVCFVPANRTRRPGQDHAASLVEVAGGVAAG